MNTLLTNATLVDLTTAAQTGLNDTLQLRNQTPYLLVQAGANTDYANLVTMNPDGTLAIDGNGYVVGVGTITSYNPFNITVTAQGSSTNLVTPSNLQNLKLYLYNGDLEVVPEPSTWALMIGGMGLLIIWRFRKQRA